jgi:hypothetical protein
MSDIIEGLLRIKHSSDAKSYFVGLERGRIWAEDSADYFEMRQWSESRHSEFDYLVLPRGEDTYFSVLKRDSPLEWTEYLRGWIDGVKQVVREY